jgi:hypothetical protein
VLIFIVWLVLCGAAAAYASSKGRSGVGIFFLSFFLSPLVGFIVALVMEPNQQKIAVAKGMKKCPECAQFVQRDAKTCPSLWVVMGFPLPLTLESGGAKVFNALICGGRNHNWYGVPGLASMAIGQQISSRSHIRQVQLNVESNVAVVDSRIPLSCL